MGGLFSSPKRTKISPAAVMEPQPEPQPIEVEVLQKEKAKRIAKMKKFGRGSTILTQGGLGSSQAASEQGTLLGGKV